MSNITSFRKKNLLFDIFGVNILERAKTNTIANLKIFGFDNKFMDELVKYNGVISGSFMFMNLLDLPMKCNDIDIYIDGSTHINKYSGDYNDQFHPFEKYLLDLCGNHTRSNSYLFVDGIIHTRIFKFKYIDVNVITLNRECIKYIDENFNLDCCKIIYDGEKYIFMI